MAKHKTPEKLLQILKKTGYEVVVGEKAVRAKIREMASQDSTPLCSGFRIFPNGEKCPGCPDCKSNDMV